MKSVGFYQAFSWSMGHATFILTIRSKLQSWK